MNLVLFCTVYTWEYMKNPRVSTRTVTSIYTSKPRDVVRKGGIPTGFDQYIRRNLSLQKKRFLAITKNFFSEWPFHSSLGFLECWYTLSKTDIAPEFWVSAYFWGSIRWFLPTFSRGHWTSLHWIYLGPKVVLSLRFFARKQKNLHESRANEETWWDWRSLRFWIRSIFLATSRGLKPQKACAFLEGTSLYFTEVHVGEISIDGQGWLKTLLLNVVCYNPSTTTTSTTSNLQVNHQTLR